INQPFVNGTAEAGSTVAIYTTSACTGSPVATGSAAAFGSPGLQVSALPSDQSTTFHATAEDAAGHISDCSSGLTYVEDSTDPTLVLDSTPDPLSNDPSPTISFHGSDANGVTFRCDFAGPSAGSGTCTSPYDFEGGNLPDGDYTAHVTAVDGALNE